MTPTLPGKKTSFAKLRGWVAPLAMALSLLACTGPSATMPATTSAIGKDLIDTYGATSVNVKIKWYRQPYLFDQKSTLTDFWRVNETLYAVSSDNNLIAMEADSGKFLWKIDLGYMPHIFRPAEYTDYIICLNRTSGVLIDRRNGKIVQRAILPFACTTAPVVASGKICVGTGADFFYGLYIDLFCAKAWPIRSQSDSDAYLAPPALVGGRRVIAASRNGLLTCVDPDFGSVIWTYRKVTGNVLGGLAADTRSVYVPSMDNKVYSFGAVDGAYLWDTHLEGTLDQTLVVARHGEMVLVPATGKGLYCLETDKGVSQWVLPQTTHIVSLSTTHVYVVAADGNVNGVRLSDGKIDKTIPLVNVAHYATNLHNATIFAITAQGKMMAIEPE